MPFFHNISDLALAILPIEPGKYCFSIAHLLPFRNDTHFLRQTEGAKHCLFPIPGPFEGFAAKTTPENPRTWSLFPRSSNICHLQCCFFFEGDSNCDHPQSLLDSMIPLQWKIINHHLSSFISIQKHITKFSEAFPSIKPSRWYHFPHLYVCGFLFPVYQWYFASTPGVFIAEPLLFSLFQFFFRCLGGEGRQDFEEAFLQRPTRIPTGEYMGKCIGKCWVF